MKVQSLVIQLFKKVNRKLTLINFYQFVASSFEADNIKAMIFQIHINIQNKNNLPFN